MSPHIIVETPYSLSVAILAARGVGIGLCNPFTVSGGMVRGVVVRAFEPAIHFRSLLLRPPDGSSSALVNDFISELYRARNELAPAEPDAFSEMNKVSESSARPGVGRR